MVRVEENNTNDGLVECVLSLLDFSLVPFVSWHPFPCVSSFALSTSRVVDLSQWFVELHIICGGRTLDICYQTSISWHLNFSGASFTSARVFSPWFCPTAKIFHTYFIITRFAYLWVASSLKHYPILSTEDELSMLTARSLELHLTPLLYSGCVGFPLRSRSRITIAKSI